MARDCYDDCIAYLDEQLGRLLDELARRGLLDNTVVIITSDHGEAFGDHGIFGHSNGVFFDEIGVPLVILSPGAPAGRVVGNPVSLRDLPATVVDRPASRPARRSRAARWRPTGVWRPGRCPRAHHPRPRGAVQPGRAATRARAASGTAGSRCPCVASGRHYIRDGKGAERLYDLHERPVRAGQPHGLRRTAPGRGRVPQDAPGGPDREPRLDRGGKRPIWSLTGEGSRPSSPEGSPASGRPPLNRSRTDRRNLPIRPEDCISGRGMRPQAACEQDVTISRQRPGIVLTAIGGGFYNPQTLGLAPERDESGRRRAQDRVISPDLRPSPFPGELDEDRTRSSVTVIPTSLRYGSD